MAPNQHEDDDDRLILRSDSSINQDPVVMILPTQGTMSRNRIIKNLLVVCVCFIMYFLGFQALANLQSTMNAADGLGVKSQAVIYVFAMISSIFLPELVIKKLGCKRTLVLTVLASCSFIASNYYPRLETLMPASALMGLAAGPLNTAVAMYISEMGLRYNGDSIETQEAVVSSFFGVFSFFLENAQIWGNLISYYVLRAPMLPIHVNQTLSRCGLDFRPDSANDTNPNLEPPSDVRRFILVTIYLLCGVAATVILGVFVDPLENDVRLEDGEDQRDYKTARNRLLSALKQMKCPYQMLLLPISVFCGMEMAFYTSDFTEAYIACSWGVQHVGFVSVCFGVSGALMALFVGPLVKYASQASVILFAAAINVATCATLFWWRPTPDQVLVYFVVAGVWGMSDAIWWSQITALYGLMFPNDREAAFSNFYFWSFFGFFLCYSYANVFTIAVKINILLCMLLIGVAGYLLCLLKIRCSARKEYVVLAHDD